MNMHFTAFGQYETLRKFIDEMENSQQFLVIRTVSLTMQEDKSGSKRGRSVGSGLAMSVDVTRIPASIPMMMQRRSFDLESNCMAKSSSPEKRKRTMLAVLGGLLVVVVGYQFIFGVDKPSSTKKSQNSNSAAPTASTSTTTAPPSGQPKPISARLRVPNQRTSRSNSSPCWFRI